MAPKTCRFSPTSRGIHEALLAALLLAATSASCEEAEPTCDEAVAHYSQGFSQDRVVWMDDRILSREEAAAHCKELGEAARARDCRQEYARWLRFLATTDGPWGTSLVPLARAFESLTACLEGTPYEYECENGQDDDFDGSADCFDPDCRIAQACAVGGYRPLPAVGSRKVDLLLVVDDDDAQESMRQELRLRLATYAGFEMQGDPSRMPDLQLALVSADAGTGDTAVPGCAQGDAVVLRTGSCGTSLEGPFIVDEAPSGCNTSWDSATGCAHDCEPAHCGSGLHLCEDGAGCPRCRNHLLPDLESALSCLLDLVGSHCPFPQPIMAVERLLGDPSRHQGFLRERSQLALLLAAPRDDCSATDPLFFAPETFPGAPSDLGPRVAFRCFHQGVTCDQDGWDHIGIRLGCTARSDEASLLHPVGSALGFLRSLRHQSALHLAMIAAAREYGDNISISSDASGLPVVDPFCTSAEGDSAWSAIRMGEYGKYGSTFSPYYGAAANPCSPYSYRVLVKGLFDRLRAQFPPACLDRPVRGCGDIAAAVGLPGDGQTCNDVCRPEAFEVALLLERDTGQEISVPLPPCLELCSSGPCPGNTDPALAYATGRPNELEPGLPAMACWYLDHDERCSSSRGTALRISFKELPGPRSEVSPAFSWISSSEVLCNDQEDNDGDCLVDADDPDCGG